MAELLKEQLVEKMREMTEVDGQMGAVKSRRATLELEVGTLKKLLREALYEEGKERRQREGAKEKTGEGKTSTRAKEKTGEGKTSTSTNEGTAAKPMTPDASDDSDSSDDSSSGGSSPTPARPRKRQQKENDKKVSKGKVKKEGPGRKRETPLDACAVCWKDDNKKPKVRGLPHDRTKANCKYYTAKAKSPA